MDLEGNVLCHYRRSFINYFSLGYDARVGFGFEKKRSGSRCWNKCIYFWEGLKKNCCRKTIPLTSFINSFQVLETKKKIISDEATNAEVNGVNAVNPINPNHKQETDNLDNFTKRKSIVYFKSRNSTVEKSKSESESETCKIIYLKKNFIL
jgi:diacylglycerol kinase (ATP)